MLTAKKEIQKLLKTLPDNSTFEDFQYHLYVLQKIQKSMESVRKGKVLTQKQAEKRLAKWLKK